METETNIKLDFESELAELARSQSEGLYSIDLSDIEYMQLPHDVRKLMQNIRENLISREDNPVHCDGYSRRTEKAATELWGDSGWLSLQNTAKGVVAYCRCVDVRGLRTLHILGFYIHDTAEEDSSAYDLFFERFTEDTGDLRFAKHVSIMSKPENLASEGQTYHASAAQRSTQLAILTDGFLGTLDRYIEQD